MVPIVKPTRLYIKRHLSFRKYKYNQFLARLIDFAALATKMICGKSDTCKVNKMIDAWIL